MMTQLDVDLSCSRCGYNLRMLDVTGRCPECGRNILQSIDLALATSNPMARLPQKLGWFGKFCAVLAVLLAIVLLILGVVGLFVGIRASFTLPPILGVLPALIAYGILRCVRLAWKVGRNDEDDESSWRGTRALPRRPRADVNKIDREIEEASR